MYIKSELMQRLDSFIDGITASAVFQVMPISWHDAARLIETLHVTAFNGSAEFDNPGDELWLELASSTGVVTFSFRAYGHTIVTIGEADYLCEDNLLDEAVDKVQAYCRTLSTAEKSDINLRCGTAMAWGVDDLLAVPEYDVDDDYESYYLVEKVGVRKFRANKAS